MQIPSRQESYQLMYKMEMLEHIAAHSIMVCTTALFITDSLIEQGIELDRDLIKAAALLHDITKTKCIKTQENHALTGEQLLCECGYPEVGYIIGKHVVLDNYTDHGSPLEVEIVNYSDKRVLNDKIVSLDIRIEYILERYGITPKYRRKIKEVGQETKKLETKLFKILLFSPEDLKEMVDSETFQSAFSDYAKRSSKFSKNNL